MNMQALHQKNARSVNLFRTLKIILFMALVLIPVFSLKAVTIGVVTRKNVNLRSGPNLNYPVVRQMSPGDLLIQINESNGWANVQRLDGTLGWINQSLIEIADSSMYLPYLKLIQRGNLRFAPTTESDVVRLMEPPQILKQILGKGDWHAVMTIDSTFGWVHDVIIETIPNSGAGMQVRTASKIRSGPGRDYQTLRIVPAGTLLEPIASLSGWYLVLCPGDCLGWIFSDLVDLELPFKTLATTIRIRTNGNVRMGPDLEYPIVSKVSPGMTVSVDRVHHDWFHVRLREGIGGWIHSILIDSSYLPTSQVSDKSHFSLDSIKVLIDIADSARFQNDYKTSVRLFQTLKPAAEEFYSKHPADPCALYVYARSVHAMAQEVTLESGQAYGEVYQLLKTSGNKGDCVVENRALVEAMETAIMIRSKILSAFADREITAEELLEYGFTAPQQFPFITEAEVYRLIGRYLAVHQKDLPAAAEWQQKSVIVFQALRKYNVDLGKLGLENYFYALMELGVSQAKLGRERSYDNFDEAYKLVDEYQNNYWREYYNRTLESLSR